MSTSHSDKLLNTYDENRHLYDFCSNEILELMHTLIKNNGAKVHEITTRVKSRESLEKKLASKDDKYKKIEDITDIIGFRIITYFSSEVDMIAKIIENEFNIDMDNSIDKRKLLDPDRFGYLSLHYIARLDNNRSNSPEYKDISALQFEIQIRSILQHSWAEIEHDLGYKSKESIPYDIRRSFSRLAGVLELADMGFAEIRNDLNIYKENIGRTLSESPQSVEINKDSLIEFMKTNKNFQEISVIMRENTLHGLEEAQGTIDEHVEDLYYFGIKNMHALGVLFEKEKENIISFFNDWIGNKRYGTLSNSLPFFYLLYILLGRCNDEHKAKKFLRKRFSDPETLYARVIDTMKKLHLAD